MSLRALSLVASLGAAVTAPVSAAPASIVKIASVGVAVQRALRLSNFAHGLQE
jgi:hypothetical protein